MSAGQEAVAWGWTLADMGARAGAAVLNGRAWWPAGDGADLADAAWHGIAEALCLAQEQPSRNALLEAGRRAVAREVRDGQRHHGARTDGTNTGAMFARYWQWHGQPAPGPEAAAVDRAATWQILAALTDRQRDAVMALAVLGDYHAAPAAMGIMPQTYRALLGRSRREFLRLWHEGETPSRLWGCDRRAYRRETWDPAELAARARDAAKARERRARRREAA